MKLLPNPRCHPGGVHLFCLSTGIFQGGLRGYGNSFIFHFLRFLTPFVTGRPLLSTVVWLLPLLISTLSITTPFRTFAQTPNKVGVASQLVNWLMPKVGWGFWDKEMKVEERRERRILVLYSKLETDNFFKKTRFNGLHILNLCTLEYFLSSNKHLVDQMHHLGLLQTPLQQQDWFLFWVTLVTLPSW